MSRSFAFLLAPLLFLTACHDGADARFSSATEEQRRQIVVAALGDEAGEMVLLPWILSPDDGAPQACPSITADGDTTTLTGGCAAGERQIEGSVVRTKAATGGSVRWNHFSLRDSADRAELSVDGAYVIGSEGDTRHVDIDATITGSSPAQQHADEVHLHLICSPYGEVCRAEPDSEVTLDGVGSADIALTFSQTGDRVSRAGVLELAGAETLRYEMKGGADGDDLCGPITIDGKDAGKLCIPRW